MWSTYGIGIIHCATCMYVPYLIGKNVSVSDFGHRLLLQQRIATKIIHCSRKYLQVQIFMKTHAMTFKGTFILFIASTKLINRQNGELFICNEIILLFSTGVNVLLLK